MDFPDWLSVSPYWQAGPNNSRVEVPGPDPGDADNPNLEYVRPAIVGNGTPDNPQFPQRSITDYGVFRAFGPEYECQYLNARNATGANANTLTNPAGYTGGADATDADYGDPYYLAGWTTKTTRRHHARSG